MGLDLHDPALVGVAGAGGLEPIDDDGLICLYNFNESSLSVPNSSTGSDSGGTDFDATGFGCQVSQTGHIAGQTAFSFDGSDDYLEMYDSSAAAKTIWNWLHDGSSWSFTYWMKRITTSGGADDGYSRIWDQLYDPAVEGGTLANGATAYIFGSATPGNGNWMITNNSKQRVLDATFSTAFWSDTDWHFYVHTMNFAPATNNLVSTIDNSTTVYATKHASYTPDTNDSVADMTGMMNAGGGNENNALVQQWTFWDKIIDSDTQDLLWNNGDGRKFY